MIHLVLPPVVVRGRIRLGTLECVARDEDGEPVCRDQCDWWDGDGGPAAHGGLHRHRGGRHEMRHRVWGLEPHTSTMRRRAQQALPDGSRTGCCPLGL